MKAVFDRFDKTKDGKLSAQEVEQALLYMNRPVDAAEVNSWLLRLKDDDIRIDFTEFVGQYSSFFAGSDPDIPAGEGGNAFPKVERDEEIDNKMKSKRSDDDEIWRDDNADDDAFQYNRELKGAMNHLLSRYTCRPSRGRFN